jgi:hypothetical protein
MTDFMTPSGIPGIGDIPWGSHFCHLFKTSEDLVQSLVPYFLTGLERDERCFWAAGAPLGCDRAKGELRKRAPELERYFREGRIVIRDHHDWYQGSAPDPVSTLLEAEEKALVQGFTGLRCAGTVTWLQPPDCDTFEQYERRVTDALRDRRIIALCGYDLDECQSGQISKAMRAHQFTLGRRDGDWELVETVLDSRHNPR